MYLQIQEKNVTKTSEVRYFGNLRDFGRRLALTNTKTSNELARLESLISVVSSFTTRVEGC
jgi:hypothetical protein